MNNPAKLHKASPPPLNFDEAQELASEARRLLRRLDEIQAALRSRGCECSFDSNSKFHCKFPI